MQFCRQERLLASSAMTTLAAVYSSCKIEAAPVAIINSSNSKTAFFSPEEIAVGARGKEEKE